MEISMTRGWFSYPHLPESKAAVICLNLIENAQVYNSYCRRNADDWAVMSVSALFAGSSAAYAGKTCLRMKEALSSIAGNYIYKIN